MKYNYYYRIGNGETIKTSLDGLRKELNKICVTYEHINEWICVEVTDPKKVEKVIRLIRKGTHYCMMGNNNKSFSCYATKGGEF